MISDTRKLRDLMSDIDGIDLTDVKGRVEALSRIAQIGVRGYTVEKLGNKSETPIKVLERDLATSIRAIGMIDKMLGATPQENIVLNINCKDSPAR